jgi:hypothetical protein
MRPGKCQRICGRYYVVVPWHCCSVCQVTCQVRFTNLEMLNSVAVFTDFKQLIRDVVTTRCPLSRLCKSVNTMKGKNISEYVTTK